IRVRSSSGEREMTRAERLISLLKTGVTKDAAARIAGISESTLMEYLARGRADTAAGRDTEFSQFLDASTCAQDELEAEVVTSMRIAGVTDWRANWELIQARLPEQTGKRNRITVETARS